MRKLRSIQALRALAACAVVAMHAHGVGGLQDTGPTRVGAAGVDLFFVISGFIMAHVARERSAAEFIKDRLWRIYPMWIIALAPWLFFTHASFSTVISS